ncbi:hypothetical protein ARMGADRAFT_1092212 [Armillaria gallica]|uniref:Uncharacterized protein n=1 Tax=Armillaria gallica TaxID=47427 RepID=A0A2H3CBH0_ARMGA|nr:hypothetical protein ARMGADRAFT_1092212 [Armillaria gallica]
MDWEADRLYRVPSRRNGKAGSVVTGVPSKPSFTESGHHTHSVWCPCQFVSTLLDQSICGLCGHGIHAHLDYVSMVVNYYPANQCAAYVQKTPLAQRCTCEAQLCDHVPTNNPYRSEEPWTVLDYFTDSNGYNAAAISYSNDAVNDPYTPSSMSFSSADSDAATQSSHGANLMPTARAPVFSPRPRHASSPSSGAENIPFASTSISSPSSSASSTIQSDITQIQAYSSNRYFVHPDHSINTYARQPDGDAIYENLHSHGGSNV